MINGSDRPYRCGPPSPPPGRVQAHAMFRALVDRVAVWAKLWVPSIVIDSTGSDFQQWMDWCVEHLSEILRYEGFRNLLSCPVGAASDQAARWEIATAI
eukprot:7168219-Pyramimonas_sp.AAC.1